MSIVASIHMPAVLGGCLILSAAGCDLIPDPPPAPVAKDASAAAKAVPLKPAPEPNWSGSGYLKLKAEGLPGAAEVRVATYSGEGITFKPIQLPVGTVIASGEAARTVAGTPDDELVVPVDEQLAKAPWESFKDPYGKVDWPITFTVTIPGHEPLTETTQPLSFAIILKDRFTAMATSEQTWPGETGPSAGEVPGAAAWVADMFDPLGTAEHLEDVRFVVMVDNKPNDKTRRCTGYVGGKDFTATSHDATVRIIDRFSDEVLAQKDFAGKPGCPKQVVAGSGSNQGPSFKTMKAWASGQLPKLAGELNKAQKAQKD